MSQTTPEEAHCPELDNSSQPSTSRRPGSQVRKSASAAAVAAESLTPVVLRSLHSGPRAIPALMDLALPQFATQELQSKRPRLQWIATHESPASPAPLRSPSLCLSLDTLSSDGSAGPGGVSAHPICISDVSSHSGDLDHVLSDDDLPLEVDVNDLPSEVLVDLVSPVSPPVSARMSQCLPAQALLVHLADSSVVISPNRVRSDSTPDEVSPDTTGFLMRPSGAAVQAPLASFPIQPGSESDCAPVLGETVAFTLSVPIPGLDAPAMTFPVYLLPSGLALLPVSRSAQMVLASGVSSQQDRWSSAVPLTRDVSREGPFDAYCSLMDTGDCPLVATGLPGCPYRITSYTGPAVCGY